MYIYFYFFSMFKSQEAPPSVCIKTMKDLDSSTPSWPSRTCTMVSRFCLDVDMVLVCTDGLLVTTVM